MVIYTNQTLFDKVWQTFVAEQHPLNKFGPNNECRYSPISSQYDGCAIGCAMTPEQQKWADSTRDTYMDSNIVFVLTLGSDSDYAIKRCPNNEIAIKVQHLFSGCDEQLLADLQHAHDSAEGLADFKNSLIEIGFKHNLELAW